ncbi:unnamed protein product, partial [marine sediment metagenome]
VEDHACPGVGSCAGPSHTPIVENSNGIPPAILIPSLTA